MMGLFTSALLGAMTWHFCLILRSRFLSNKMIENPTPTLIKQHALSFLSPFNKILSIYCDKITHLLESIRELGQESTNLIARHELLTENIAASIVMRDGSGKITYCSPFTEVLTGYPLNDIYQAKEDFFLTITHEDDRATYQRAFKVSAVGEPFQFRCRICHKSGIVIWAETRTVPILDCEGNVISSLSVTIDVTGTVRYQTQVEEKNRDLQDFAYMVSHDLKAPIFTIKGMLGVIEQDSNQTDCQGDLKEPLNHISRATNRLEELVSSVLEYSRISNQEYANEAVDLALVMNEVAQDYAPQLNSLNGRLIIPDNLPIVFGDKVRLYQIFSNLIGNAIKYRDSNRQLTINIDYKSMLRHSYIEIHDNGLGIPSDKIGGIFRPFQRVHAGDIEGSGIGLACVKKLSEKLGGSVEVSSKLGEGSIFRVTLRQRIT